MKPILKIKNTTIELEDNVIIEIKDDKVFLNGKEVKVGDKNEK